MGRNQAIVIGINQYEFLRPLKYAKSDAEAIATFLKRTAKFDQVFLFTDSSPPINDKTTEPFRANLLRVLLQIFETKPQNEGDNFWFFFSGHGAMHDRQDYLMPWDGDPGNIPNTGISTNTITNYLRNCGVDNAVMILDACRNGGIKSGEGIGRQTAADAQQAGVTSFFSCSSNEYSYELEEIQQGAFTKALIEGLEQFTLPALLENHLKKRVSELNSRYHGGKQNPRIQIEPVSNAYRPLLPRPVTSDDIGAMFDLARELEQTSLEAAEKVLFEILNVSPSSGISATAESYIRRIRAKQQKVYFPRSENPPTESRQRSSIPIQGENRFEECVFVKLNLITTARPDWYDLQLECTFGEQSISVPGGKISFRLRYGKLMLQIKNGRMERVTPNEAELAGQKITICEQGSDTRPVWSFKGKPRDHQEQDYIQGRVKLLLGEAYLPEKNITATFKQEWAAELYLDRHELLLIFKGRNLSMNKRLFVLREFYQLFLNTKLQPYLSNAELTSINIGGQSWKL